MEHESDPFGSTVSATSPRFLERVLNNFPPRRRIIVYIVERAYRLISLGAPLAANTGLGLHILRHEHLELLHSEYGGICKLWNRT